MKKLTSYQKLKARIAELEQYKTNLYGDIYIIMGLSKVVYEHEISTKLKYQIMFTTEQAVWMGNFKSLPIK